MEKKGMGCGDTEGTDERAEKIEKLNLSVGDWATVPLDQGDSFEMRFSRA